MVDDRRTEAERAAQREEIAQMLDSTYGETLNDDLEVPRLDEPPELILDEDDEER